MRRLAGSAVLLVATLLAAGGCAYPRRGTAISTVRQLAPGTTPPGNLWSFALTGAEIPPLSRGALRWDDDGEPDPFLRVYRDDVLVWESPTVENSRTPRWEARMPANFFAPPSSLFRFELWDRDAVGAEPIGSVSSRALPPALVTEADAGLFLEGGARLMVRIGAPQPSSGVGLRLCELRSDALVVLEVETYSPAGRAGVHVGDAIVGVGDQTVAQLGAQRALGAVSMASERGQRLRVRDPRGAVREVELDRDYTWLTQ